MSVTDITKNIIKNNIKNIDDVKNTDEKLFDEFYEIYEDLMNKRKKKNIIEKGKISEINKTKKIIKKNNSIKKVDDYNQDFIFPFISNDDLLN